MLTIPEKITIKIVDKQGNAVHHANILVGIRTNAVNKNDVELSPFATDTNGLVIITKKQFDEAANKFITQGLMDYSELISAKPEVNIFVIPAEIVNKRIEYLDELLGTYQKNEKYLTASSDEQQIKLLMHTIQKSKLENLFF